MPHEGGRLNRSCRTRGVAVSSILAAAVGAASFGYAGDSIDPSADGTHAYARSPAGRLLAASDGTTSRLVALNRHGDLSYTFDPSGTLSSTRAYEPFGEVAGSTGTFSPALGYQGDFTDPASGGVWMGARWYAPEASVFLSRDSYPGVLSTPVTLNRYTYANADPLGFFDPDGHAGCELNTPACTMARILETDADYPGGPPSPVGLIAGTERLANQVRATANLVMDRIHTGLDIVGMIPGPVGVASDLANAGLYYARGDTASAMFSLGMAAVVGPGVKAAGAVKRWVKAGDAADGAAGIAKTTRGASDHLRAPPEALARARGASDEALDAAKGARGAGAPPRSAPRAAAGAESAEQGARLRTHLRLTQDYGAGSVRELTDGRIRYYDVLDPARKPGTMAGRRLVREWDPATGRMRTWHETLDHQGRIRQVRPVDQARHYTFDEAGSYTGYWPEG